MRASDNFGDYLKCRFTAELLAISMALQHISAIPVTPFAIVICSDLKAALTAIKSDSQNASCA